MTELETFEKTKAEFIRLCERYEIPIPIVKLAQPGDTEDYITHVSVSIGRYETGNDIRYQAAYLFGHYICELHYISTTRPKHGMAGTIADLIANWIHDSGVYG